MEWGRKGRKRMAVIVHRAKSNASGAPLSLSPTPTANLHYSRRFYTQMSPHTGFPNLNSCNLLWIYQLWDLSRLCVLKDRLQSICISTVSRIGGIKGGRAAGISPSSKPFHCSLPEGLKSLYLLIFYHSLSLSPLLSVARRRNHLPLAVQNAIEFSSRRWLHRTNNTLPNSHLKLYWNRPNSNHSSSLSSNFQCWNRCQKIQVRWQVNFSDYALVSRQK